MKLNKFIMEALKKGIVFDGMTHGMSFYHHKKLADLTKHVKFHCNFNSKGRCANYRNNKGATMCCCIGCFTSMGYLNSLPAGGYRSYMSDGLEDLKFYARRFSEKTIVVDDFKRKMGFWRPGKGCILPRSYRSRTCLGYDCARSGERSVWEKKLFRLLDRKPKFPVKIRGLEYKSHDLAEGMLNWYKELNDQHNSK